MTNDHQRYALTPFHVLQPDCVRDNNWFYGFWRKHGVSVDESFIIDTRTGIQSRPHFCPKRSFVDVAVEMVNKLKNIVEADYRGACAGFLLVTSRPETPATALAVAERTGLSGEVINWACSGFPGAISKLVADAERPRRSKPPEPMADRHRIVIWLEMWRDMINLCNFRMAPLFGDCCVGTTFTGITPSCSLPGSYFAIRDAFARRIGIDKPAIWLNKCVDGTEYFRDVHTGKQRTRPVLDADGKPYNGVAADMDGKTIFREAPRHMIDVAEIGLRRCGLRFEDAADLLPHSANERMRPPMADLLNTRGYRRHGASGPAWQDTDIHMDMKQQGNPGSGAIPLKLQRRQHLYRPGDIIAAPAVGAGRGVGNWDQPDGDDEIIRAESQRGELTEGNVILEVVQSRAA
jgi:3-oxoacyl-[acyl-carrier-protein] synthase III